MDDVLEHIGIAALRYRREEVPCNNTPLFRATFRLQAHLRARDDSRLIKHNRMCPRAGLHDRCRQRPVAAANVDDRVELGKVVGGQNRRDIQAGHIGLVGIEDRCGCVRVVEVGEQRLVMNGLESGLARSDAV